MGANGPADTCRDWRGNGARVDFAQSIFCRPLATPALKQKEEEKKNLKVFNSPTLDSLLRGLQGRRRHRRRCFPLFRSSPPSCQQVGSSAPMASDTSADSRSSMLMRAEDLSAGRFRPK